MRKSAGRAPSLRVFTLAFALQLRKKHGKTTVRVRETSVRLIKTSEYSIHITERERERERETHARAHTHTHTYIYIYI
jgi:NADP-dependent 3-hydroxy acid dehydrogenase YdfG